MRPSLQDGLGGGSCPVLSGGTGCVSPTPVLVPKLSPLVPILFRPALLVIAVVRVIFDLSALPSPFPDTPAVLLIAMSLALCPGIGKKKPLAVGVGNSNLLDHGPPSGRKP
jgi:hypothetical protein